MKKIKIIKIEVGEAPEGYYARDLQRVIRKPLKLTFLEQSMTNPNLEETYMREILPLQIYAYNNHYEEYYIRDEDKAKFEELISVYTQRARADLLEEIWSSVASFKGKGLRTHIMGLLQALRTKFYKTELETKL